MVLISKSNYFTETLKAKNGLRLFDFSLKMNGFDIDKARLTLSKIQAQNGVNFLVPEKWTKGKGYQLKGVFKDVDYLKKGKEKGANIANGLKMLELQAEKSWEIWNT